MALAPTAGIVLLPFAERQRYGDAHPIGLAVGHIDQTGDASGNPLTASFLADGGFLFRLEMIQATLGSTTPVDMNFILAHRWASDRSGFGDTAFDMNWVLEERVSASGAFGAYSPAPADLQQIRRFPLGRTDNVTAQFIASFNSTNQNGLVYDYDIVMSYWRVEALYRPGFLASFFESPFIPLPAR